MTNFLQIALCTTELPRTWIGLLAVQKASLIHKHLFNDAFVFFYLQKIAHLLFSYLTCFFFPAANSTTCTIHLYKAFSIYMSHLAFHIKIHENITNYINCVLVSRWSTLQNFLLFSNFICITVFSCCNHLVAWCCLYKPLPPCSFIKMHITSTFF